MKDDHLSPLEQAALDHVNQQNDMMDKLANAPPLEDGPSKIDRRIEKEITKQRDSRKKRIHTTKAAVILLVLGMFSTGYIAAQAFETNPVRWIIEWCEDHARIRRVTEDMKKSGFVLAPSWLPNQYDLFSVETYSLHVTAFYSSPSDNRVITFEQHRGSVQQYFDNEKDTLIPVTIGEKEGFASSSNGVTFIVWNCDAYDYSFLLYCPDDLNPYRIAESVKTLE